MTGRGRFVVLLGADGSGKSSVAAAMKTALAGDFVGVETRHYRPQTHDTGRPVPDPHGRPPRSMAGSFLKLALDLVRFRWGYRRVVRRLLAENRLVIFDRYYHDVLADPLRYRYGGPDGIARWAGRLVPAPDLFIVLDVPPDVLQARKAEVAAADSAAARTAYLELAQVLERAHVVDGSRPLDRVVADAVALVLAC